MCAEFALKSNADIAYMWRQGRDTKGVRVLIADNTYETVYSLFDISFPDGLPQNGEITVFDREYTSSEEDTVSAAGISVPGLYEKTGDCEVNVFSDGGQYIMEVTKWH